jgi:hypothetical protein
MGQSECVVGDVMRRTKRSCVSHVDVDFLMRKYLVRARLC